MKHPFHYKLIGHIPEDLLSRLQEMVARQPYSITPDFKEHVIRICNKLSDNDQLLLDEFYDICMSKYFRLTGNLGTNIARMAPNCYLFEHSDYTAVNYGKIQDSIIKLQVPITTNDRVGMMWAGDSDLPSSCVNMVAGGIYIIDNVRVHSCVNLSDEYRYNLTCRFHIDSVIDPITIV
jgi:hypothetical protein